MIGKWQVTPARVSELRRRTQAGLLKCRDALTSASITEPTDASEESVFEKATEILRKQGLSDGGRKDKPTSQGLVHSYIHPGGQVGVLLELNCETDFVSRNANFKQLANDIAMQIAAAKPEFISPEDIPLKLSQEQVVNLILDADRKKPEAIQAKIAKGKMEKWYSQVVLLEQPFVKDDSQTIKQIIQQASSILGETIRIKRFVRFEVGR